MDTISTSVEDEDLIYFSNGIRLGALKVIGKDLKKIYDIETPVFVAELSVQAISEAISKLPSKTYKPIPKFPGFEFDFAVIVNGSVTAGSLIDAIKSKAGKSLQNIEIFDVFEGESIGSGNKSLAFRLNFLDPNKTLNIKEVEPIIKRIVKYLEKEFSAKLRA